MSRLTISNTGSGPICDQIRITLKKWSIAYDEIRLHQEPAALPEFSEKTNGACMVAQILFDGRWIGGITELSEMHMQHQLVEFMERA